MDVVKKMEGEGSRSGGTKSKVLISDCGEVAAENIASVSG